MPAKAKSAASRKLDFSQAPVCPAPMVIKPDGQMFVLDEKGVWQHYCTEEGKNAFSKSTT